MKSLKKGEIKLMKYITDCSSCNYKFSFVETEASLSSGPMFKASHIVRCPQCETKNYHDVNTRYYTLV